MTADGKSATPHKRYYDFSTWLITQLAFSFTTAPFILLTVHDSFTAWARVYFYAIVGVIACSIFLITPGKPYLQRRVAARSTRPPISRSTSQIGTHEQTLGVPSEPGREFSTLR